MPEPVGGFQVQVFVNRTEVTSRAAGLGMDPFDLLFPDNRLIATNAGHVAAIARCSCGEYEADATDVRIVREGSRVRWEWLRRAPMKRPVSFVAAEYDAEIDRVTSDFSWEPAGREVARLVLGALERELLATSGLIPTHAGDAYDDPTQFEITFSTVAEEYQVFLRIPWQGRTPDELAKAVLDQLAQPPQAWEATYHPTSRHLTGPPRLAGPRWHRAAFNW